ncbi:cyclin-H [Lethenteron reissneri]|uniref:cyclin-H n=1 Tax=Lethenteron reissneri TaxID=7753 RepID=UPI002AB76D91|nr:cyclin-H [Lethenteron reissneri]XP_061428451.1 cyclin-H [Lethenteron reissneri]
MYHNSTQKTHWTFGKEEEIAALRREANERFKTKLRKNAKGPVNDSLLLTPSEELALCRHYERCLQDLCTKFKPPMPRSTQAIACCYFKRFYLNNSVMEYHPRNILLTAAFLACKADEFNVSSMQFVGNLQQEAESGREQALQLVLAHELLLTQELRFHLTIHTPYRPLEGFLIHIKTNFAEVAQAEALRKGAEEFLQRALSTDACLLASPAQIALAALLAGASRTSVSIERYIKECLCGDEFKEDMTYLMDTVQNLRKMVKCVELPKAEMVGTIKQHLEQCAAHCQALGSPCGLNKRKTAQDDHSDGNVQKRAKLQKDDISSEEEFDLQ